METLEPGGSRRRSAPSSIPSALRATWRRLLDAFFPWSCVGCGREGSALFCRFCVSRIGWIEGALCARCGLPLPSGPDRFCGRCLRRPPAFATARAIAFYRAGDEENDPLATAIRALKYSRRRALAGPLSELLAERFPFDPARVDLLVPVPLHVDRLRERGFNQALLLAREPARRFGLRVGPLVLERLRPTPPQVGLDEPSRRRNLRGAFAVRRPDAVRGARVLLVDDVATSTATAEACAGELVRSSADRVDVLTLARTGLR